MRKNFSSLLIIILSIYFLPTTAAAAVPDLTLEQKIGQMMVVGFRGLTLSEADDIRLALNKNMLGGVILFDYDVALKSRPRNIASPQQLKQLTTELKNSSQIPLFIAVDQEGGRVARLNEHNGFNRGSDALYIGTWQDDTAIMQEFNHTAKQIALNGININLAPVVDLCTNPDNPVIAKLKRCYAADSETVTRLASMFIRAHTQYKILTVLKHFPGHGSSLNDSHLGYVDISTLWHEYELQPYKALISQGIVDMVMVAHVFNNTIDADYPASLSTKAITQLLKTELGYKGLVISDDLQMDALQKHYSEQEILYHAIMAGNDLLIFGNNLKFEPDLLQRKIAIILNLINEGKIPRDRIDQSWKKIYEIKQRLE